jgi:hypothetical protein
LSLQLRVQRWFFTIFPFNPKSALQCFGTKTDAKVSRNPSLFKAFRKREFAMIEILRKNRDYFRLPDRGFPEDGFLSWFSGVSFNSSFLLRIRWLSHRKAIIDSMKSQ